MIDVILVFVLIIAIYGTKRLLDQRLAGICMLIGMSSRTYLWIYHLTVFPGVVVHELSHFFTAAALNVKTGDIELFPRTLSASGRTALGSVPVAKTDPVRMTLIGSAPLFYGLMILYLLTYFLTEDIFLRLGLLPALKSLAIHLFSGNFHLWLWLYGVIVTALTMFLSPEDRRAFPGFLAIVAVIGLSLWIFGLITPVQRLILPIASQIAQSIQLSLVVSLVVLAFLTLLLQLLIVLLQSILRKKIVYDAANG